MNVLSRVVSPFILCSEYPETKPGSVGLSVNHSAEFISLSDNQLILNETCFAYKTDVLASSSCETVKRIVPHWTAQQFVVKQ